MALRNTLHVLSMKSNLIPLFLVLEAGIQVNSMPKIQVEYPITKDHSLYFPEADLRIPLPLWGIFSYFPTTITTLQMMEECENMLSLPQMDNGTLIKMFMQDIFISISLID